MQGTTYFSAGTALFTSLPVQPVSLLGHGDPRQTAARTAFIVAHWVPYTHGDHLGSGLPVRWYGHQFTD